MPQALDAKERETESSNVLEEWLLASRVQSAFERVDVESGAARYAVETLQTLLQFQSRTADEAFLSEVFADEAASKVLGVNAHEGVLWFNREAWETWSAQWLLACAVMASQIPARTCNDLDATTAQWNAWLDSANAVSFQVEPFVMPMRDATVE